MACYSDYVLKRAKATKLKANWIESTFLVNDKYTLRFNKKTNMWDICDCKWYNDGKSKKSYCSHVLGLLYHLEHKKYLIEIGK